MTQDEKWLKNYDEVMDYMEEFHRNPSKYALEDRQMYTWLKHQRKLMNAGKLSPERKGLFEMLLALAEQLKRTNQYG
jgi:hypothetical protein